MRREVRPLLECHNSQIDSNRVWRCQITLDLDFFLFGPFHFGRFVRFGAFVSVVSVISLALVSFWSFRSFQPFWWFCFARFGGFGHFVSVVLFHRFGV